MLKHIVIWQLNKEYANWFNNAKQIKKQLESLASDITEAISINININIERKL